MRLSEVLVKRGIISDAQMELAMADREINDLPLEEVLLARGWIREDVLYDAAPWLKGTAAAKPAAAKPAPTSSSSSGTSAQKPADKPAQKADTKAPPPGPAGSGANQSPLQSDYNDNLRAYRELLNKATGKELTD